MITDRQKDFLMKEYDALRREVEATLSEQESLTRNVPVAAAAIAAWLFTQKTLPDWGRLAWFIPAAVLIFGAIRASIIGGIFTELSEYVRGIEEEFSLPEKARGWEHFRAAKRKRWFAKAKGVGFFAYWITLIAISIRIAIHYLGMP
jgi:hypothetical protein